MKKNNKERFMVYTEEEKYYYENNYYLTCDTSRIGKMLAHNELYKKIINLSGAVVELGVFKGASLCRFAMLRNLYEINSSRKIIGFDTFAGFPDTEYDDDKYFPKLHNDISASITKEKLYESLDERNLNNAIELIEGDITKTVPEYVKNNPALKISLLNLDTDVYEPAVTALEYLYPCVCNGGVVIIDNYAQVPGETKVIDEYFKDNNLIISKFPYSPTPSYFIK